MFILGVDVGIKEVDILCQFSMVKGLCTVNVAWEEQANGPEGAYCRVPSSIHPSMGLPDTLFEGGQRTNPAYSRTRSVGFQLFVAVPPPVTSVSV